MKKIFSTTIFAIIVASIWYVVTLDNRIARHIEKTASYLTGVPVTLESVSLSLLKGQAEIRGLVVPNPAGYSDNNAFSLGKVSFDVDMGSLFSQPLIIDSVVISDTQVNLELKPNFDSNLQDIVNVSTQQNAPSASTQSSSQGGSSGQSSDTAQTQSEQSAEDSGDRSDSEIVDANDTKEGNENKKDNAYLMRIKTLTIDGANFSAVREQDSWSDSINNIVIKELNKPNGVSTRAIGITVVRKLTSTIIQQSATRKITEQIKTLVQDKVEEVKSKLLESLLKKE